LDRKRTTKKGEKRGSSFSEEDVAKDKESQIGKRVKAVETMFGQRDTLW